MEEEIIEKLHNSGQTDFMIFRSYFLLSPKFRIAYENLKDLKLIEEVSFKGTSFVNLSDEGVEASLKGLETWVEQKVYEDIREGKFILNKSTTRLEVEALRRLKNEGEVYEYSKRQYKIGSGPSNFIKIPKPGKTRRNTKGQSTRAFFNNSYVQGIIITVVGGIVVYLIISTLSSLF